MRSNIAGIRSYRHYGIGSGHIIERRHYEGKETLADIRVIEEWSTEHKWTRLGHRTSSPVCTFRKHNKIFFSNISALNNQT